MSTVAVLCSLSLMLGAATLALSFLHTHGRASGLMWRREIQLAILATPPVGLLLSLGVLTPLAHASLCRADLLCGPEVVSTAETLGAALILGMALIALGGLGLGLVRFALMVCVLQRRSWAASPALQTVANRLAQDLKVPAPRVRMRLEGRPLALTYGFVRPTVLLSTWMVEHLDACELEAVLAHELGHIARRDHQVVWMATILRDAFFYLPTSQAAYRKLQREMELACDDLAVGVTQRPLGMASALTKVWLHTLSGGSSGASLQSLPLSPSFMGARAGAQLAHEAIESRITRLLEHPDSSPESGAPARPQRVRVSAPAVMGLLLAGTGVIVLLLGLMGCMQVALPFNAV